MKKYRFSRDELIELFKTLQHGYEEDVKKSSNDWNQAKLGCYNYIVEKLEEMK